MWQLLGVGVKVGIKGIELAGLTVVFWWFVSVDFNDGYGILVICLESNHYVQIEQTLSQHYNNCKVNILQYILTILISSQIQCTYYLKAMQCKKRIISYLVMSLHMKSVVFQH